MRPFTSTLPFADALARALSVAAPVTRTEHVTLTEADGRVVAHDVMSPLDVPGFDRSAMDGYAVGSLAGPFTNVGRVFTGEVLDQAVGPGECVETATGAPLPTGAVTVVPVEHTRTDTDGRIVVDGAIAAGQHIGRRAADLALGARVVALGQVLTPSRLGALAATGHRTVEVFARPSVAIVSTGNEVVTPGLPLAPGQLYDINRFTLDAVTRRHGGWPVALASPKDTLDDLRRILDVAMAHDLIVFSGGSSVGDRDLVRDVIHERGTMLFHGIAVKPGKPTACATLSASDGRTVIFLGMPGNPTSCLSNAYILLIPVLRKMAGLPPWEPRTIDVPLARTIRSASDRHQFYTVRLVTIEGQVMAEPAFKGSGDITSMADADGYVEIPASTASIEAGIRISVTLF